MRLEGLDQLKKIHLIRTRTRYLPACSIVPEPNTFPFHDLKICHLNYSSSSPEKLRHGYILAYFIQFTSSQPISVRR
jgi:hypothetical protein